MNSWNRAENGVAPATARSTCASPSTSRRTRQAVVGRAPSRPLPAGGRAAPRCTPRGCSMLPRCAASSARGSRRRGCRRRSARRAAAGVEGSSAPAMTSVGARDQPRSSRRSITCDRLGAGWRSRRPTYPRCIARISRHDPGSRSAAKPGVNQRADGRVASALRALGADGAIRVGPHLRRSELRRREARRQPVDPVADRARPATAPSCRRARPRPVTPARSPTRSSSATRSPPRSAIVYGPVGHGRARRARECRSRTTRYARPAPRSCAVPHLERRTERVREDDDRRVGRPRTSWCTSTAMR